MLQRCVAYVTDGNQQRRCRLMVRPGTHRCAAGHLQPDVAGQMLLFDPEPYVVDTGPDDSAFPHKLSVRMPDEPLGALLQRAGVQFDVALRPVYADDEGTMRVMEGRTAVLRSDTRDILGDVSNAWTPIPNQVIHELIRGIEQDPDPTMRARLEQVLIYRRGQQCFYTLRLPDGAHGFDPPVEERICIVNSFNGTQSERVVLSTTLKGYPVIIGVSEHIGDQAFASTSVRHVASAQQRTQDAAELVRLAHRAHQRFLESASKLASYKLQEAYPRVLTTWLGPERADQATQIADIWRHDERLPASLRQASSAWGLFLAGTLWLYDRFPEHKSEADRIRSGVSGTLRQRRQQLFSLLMHQMEQAAQAN